jgi:BT1 family/Magnesium chelatase, subunit ChlI
MLARRLTTILPAMTLAEALETTRTHSVAGLTGGGLPSRPPSRAEPRPSGLWACGASVRGRVMRHAARALVRQAEARRLALVFAVVYVAQGVWDLPAQPIAFVLKERFGYSATQVASFCAVATLPWLITPAYGLLSDGVPLCGRRRKSSLMVTAALATTAGLGPGLLPGYTPWRMALLCAAMGRGLAFTDVGVDALMVEHGRRWRLTGA